MPNNKTIFDLFGTTAADLDLLFKRQWSSSQFSQMFGQMSASGAVFNVSPAVTGRAAQVHVPLTVSGFQTMQSPDKVLKWLFTVAAPDGCPSCKNPTDGAWTVHQHALHESHVLICDACGWQYEVTSEVIADFVMGHIDDVRDFDECACGKKKRRKLKACPACTEAARWDVCSCGSPKLKTTTQCPVCQEKARWDTCGCGVLKLKAHNHCPDCSQIERQIGSILTTETGGFTQCLTR